MAKKLSGWKTRGMNRDLSVSAFNPEFAFENINLRLSTNESNTLLSWVNEKGTTKIKKNSQEDIQLMGIPIGTAVLNHRLIVFTTLNTNPKTSSDNDCIYVLEYTEGSNKTQMQFVLYNEHDYLFKGNLNLCTENPLETLVSYEAENIQKVYWTDDRNQPRVVNIAGTISENDNTQFDFIPELKLGETVKIKKELGANGMFAPGVIQYAFTYYRKYGQESNIFYTSPLLYISYRDRGASPEDKVENSFKITISNIDTRFDYIRIYSIQRTSLDATPICKRVQDIDIKGHQSSDVISYIDTGTNGDSIDPMELLYKGGENITAKTIEQKDDTLFLGNILIKRNMLDATLKKAVTDNYELNFNQTRTFKPLSISSSTYIYSNQLTSEGLANSRHDGMTVPCGGFKTGDFYRCGVQFQYKSGKWSEPIYLKDDKITSIFRSNDGNITVPVIKGTLKNGALTPLKDAGYVKARAVVVFPNIMDRDVLCQGVVCPTIETAEDSNKYQSSWFFRPWASDEDTPAETIGTTTVFPKSKTGPLAYTSRQIASGDPDATDHSVYDPAHIRKVEIQGHFKKENKMQINRHLRTLHSPDIEFDDQLTSVDYTGLKYQVVGTVLFTNTLSDIDIQTETPTISSKGSGFCHKEFSSNGPNGIVSGLFYDDGFADDDVDNKGAFGVWPVAKAAAKWLVYPWHGTGSLNNDITRPSSGGIASALLRKKIISNLRYTTSALKEYSDRATAANCPQIPQLFSSNENEILKFDITEGGETIKNIYKGNVDTMLMPDEIDGTYFCFDGWGSDKMLTEDKSTAFDSTEWCKTVWTKKREEHLPSEYYDMPGLCKWNKSNKWELYGYEKDEIGETYKDLVVKKVPVRMKYKSTKHLFVDVPGLNTEINPVENHRQLAIVEIQKDPTGRDDIRFGGQSDDAKKANIWLPCGEPVSLNNVDGDGNVIFWYDYGDTYYQRYDCLKTYAYTPEDINQIVEIGSFMLETRVNIDGRYDRNRGQMNNLNMSPQNFNLLNPVYSQQDNFFQYRIMDSSTFEQNRYPNQLTWSKTKISGTDTDLWTNVTLASVLELDGSNGELNSLQRFNNQLVAFQDTGISHILYNENVQIQSTQGVPIEIANSGKVQGKDYKSNTIGCSNKWSIVNTPIGIYFMDSHEKSIFLFNGQLTNVSSQLGFNSWTKQNIPDVGKQWTPNGFQNFVAYYDKLNQDVLFIKEKALAYSERLGAFTSFYDYGGTPYFCNLDNTGVWLKPAYNVEQDKWYTNSWKHQAGGYCNFFGTQQPFSMTLVGNPEPQTDKIFTNLEFRATVDGEGDTETTPYLPFNTLETWDEYQHGITTLSHRNGHSAFIHHSGDDSSLKRKFRIWRCDIPRDNAALALDEGLNIKRFKTHPIDRMRNPWLYLKLMKNANSSNLRTEIHDIVMTYFG